MINPAWDDEMCLRFAEAYDREDAAQMGEPSPHDFKDEAYAEWAASRISCVRAGLGAVVLDAIKRHGRKLTQGDEG
jgi:hypothetical protein